MDGAGYALEGLQVPIKDRQFFTVFFEVDSRMRKVISHHRVHPQALLSDIAVQSEDRLIRPLLVSCLILPSDPSVHLPLMT